MAFLLCLLTASCASLHKPEAGAGFENAWSGRLLLKADTQPPTQLSAAFELQGSAQNGRLSLFTPLGTTVASAHWEPGAVELQGMGKDQTFASLDELTEALTGTPLPVAAWFAWLQGQPQTAEGWEVDLSQTSTGRLSARRGPPGPTAEIRLVLDRPIKTAP